MSRVARGVMFQNRVHGRGEQTETTEARQKPNQHSEEGLVGLQHRCCVDQLRAHGFLPFMQASSLRFCF